MTTLMAIGGAVDFEEQAIFKEFIKRAGGAKARIIVLPQASGLANTGREYCETFQGLGLKSKPISLEFRERKNADKEKHLEAVRDASGIFIAGRTQMLRKRNHRDVVFLFKRTIIIYELVSWIVRFSKSY